MPTINELQDEIIEEFSALDDWMDRYALIIDLGNTLEPLPESDKTPTNIIEGCQSRVWITAHFDGERVHFQGESDAIIVKGIVSLLIRSHRTSSTPTYTSSRRSVSPSTSPLHAPTGSSRCSVRCVSSLQPSPAKAKYLSHPISCIYYPIH